MRKPANDYRGNFTSIDRKFVGINLALLPILILCLAPFVPVRSQDSITKTIEEAVLSDWDARRPGSAIPLLIQPLPKLREYAIDLQRLQHPSKMAGFRVLEFYGITHGSYKMDGESIREISVLLDQDEPYWLVATDKNGTIYRLEGFETPIAEFNELIKSLKLTIHETDDALDVLQFYWQTCNRKISESNLVVDRFSLQSAAIEDFRSKYSFPRIEREFKKWYSRVSPKTIAALSFPKAARHADGFVANYWIYDSGRIVKETVIITKEGLLSRKT